MKLICSFESTSEASTELYSKGKNQILCWLGHSFSPRFLRELPRNVITHGKPKCHHLVSWVYRASNVGICDKSGLQSISLALSQSRASPSLLHVNTVFTHSLRQPEIPNYLRKKVLLLNPKESMVHLAYP